MADQRVNIKLSATNNASSVISDVNRDLGTLKQNAGEYGAGGGGGGIGLGGLATAGALAYGAVQMGQAVYGMGEDAAQVEAVEKAFANLSSQAGTTSADMLAAMKTASAGTISEYDLMLAANRAYLLGVADTPEEITALMDVARTRGRAMGLSTSQAFGDIVTGLGRASPMILDNLGIVIDADQVYGDYAASLGKATDELTEVERKQALVNSVMAESGGGGDVTSTLDDYERLNAELTDFKTNVGNVANAGVSPVVGGAASALGTVNDTLDYLDRSTLEVENDLQRVGTALETAEMNFGRNRDLIQAGVDSPEVMTAYLESMRELNSLTREQQNLQRELNGVSYRGEGVGATGLLLRPESEKMAQIAAEAGVMTAELAKQRAELELASFAWEGYQTTMSQLQTAPPAATGATGMFAGVSVAAEQTKTEVETTFAGLQAKAQGEVAQARGALVSGMSEAGTQAGDELVMKTVAALGAKMGSFSASGASAGASWKAAFLQAALSGLPGALSDAVANAVTPRVEQNIRTQGSLRSAQ